MVFGMISEAIDGTSGGQLADPSERAQLRRRCGSASVARCCLPYWPSAAVRPAGVMKVGESGGQLVGAPGLSARSQTTRRARSGRSMLSVRSQRDGRM